MKSIDNIAKLNFDEENFGAQSNLWTDNEIEKLTSEEDQRYL